ncbi:MAG: hypothetical protein Q9217_001245 [Psora testacea]
MPTLTAYVLTYNCGRRLTVPHKLASHLFSALPSPSPPPEILVFCLQEVAPIAYSFLGGSYLLPYLERFTEAVDIAASKLDGAAYVNDINRNVGMTAIMVFTLCGQANRLKWIQTAEVGVGLWEMGNKGAVGVRMGYATGQSTSVEITFVAAHLAPMEWACERRNQDWGNIVRGLVFEPASNSYLSESESRRHPDDDPDDDETAPLFPSAKDGEADPVPAKTGIYTPTTHLFLGGDLNYRTASTPPSRIDQSRFPQPCEDESSPRHYWHLLSSDQLTAEMRAGRTCHGLKEAPVDFPPTYKYSNLARSRLKTGETTAEEMDDEEKGRWEWAMYRWPSWCDRVLYLDAPPWMKAARVQVKGYKALPLMASSDHRPVVCCLSFPTDAIPEPTAAEQKGGVRYKPPFALNPHWKQKRNAARRLEVVVGIAAYLTTTREARWIILFFTLFLITLGLGVLMWGIITGSNCC